MSAYSSGFSRLAVAAVAAVAGLQAQPSPDRALVNRYCATCHNEKLKTADLLLDKLDVDKAGEAPAAWERVIQKMSTGAMPPAGLPRPDQAAAHEFISHLETALDKEAEAYPNPGHPSIHRLNRAEYANAVRDLLDVEIDTPAILPADDSAYGFDNIGAALSVSPMLLERYVAAARKISRLAIGDPAAKTAFETYTLPKFLLQDDRMGESLPFGSRGGIAIRHQFSEDGEYVVKIRLRRDYRDYVIGNAEQNRIEVRLDGARVKLFTVGGEHKGRSAPLFSTNELGDPAQEEYERTADKGLEVRFPAKAGARLVEVAFLKEETMPEGPFRPALTQRGLTQYKGGDPSVDSVVVGGPYKATGLGDTPSRRRIFVCRPANASEEEPCARKILSTLARRAYRRPVTDADMQVLMGFYKTGRAKGDFEAGIGMALRRVLGPEFLFRIERDPAGIAEDTSYRIADLELASRLSFFLWSSIPDDQLLNLAVNQKLHEPAVLDQQVRRMLADPKSQSLVSNFAAEWLYLRNLAAAKPDTEEFPEFDENLREAFKRETELFLASNIREDRGVPELLNANYTFVNERLARHYGIPNVYGSQFRRVTLNDPNRGGLLGEGSILTVTSYANRTAPTIRGKWILENFLGTPPPPPPANVPALLEGKDTKSLTMRQRMEQHRANPVCASCHAQMDPLGFSLENFDGVGRWRAATESHAAIDPSGVLPDGTKFKGPDGLRNVLLSHPEQFVRTATEKLLTYALGRGVEYYDQPAIRKIMRDAAPGNYRWSSLILGIVNSTPFQMRKSEKHDDL